jgi:hypothetical protein
MKKLIAVRSELVGNFQTQVLFEQADSDDKGETTTPQNWIYQNQQKFFNLLGTHICMPLLPSGFSNVGVMTYYPSKLLKILQ